MESELETSLLKGDEEKHASIKKKVKQTKIEIANTLLAH
jgi:hypothetical protein